jgi:hypothetical protein
MRKPGGVVLAVVLASSTLASATGASAATEVGSACVGTTSLPNYTLVQTGSAPGGLAATVPSAGIVTAWSVNAPVFAGERVEYLKVFKDTAKANEFQVVDESAGGVIHSGLNTFAARILVQAGYRFGVYGGGEGAYYCSTTHPADTMGRKEGNSPVGSVLPYTAVTQFQPSLVAVVEPDADGDGYGDETQDKCPQSAQYFEIACPPLTLSFYSIAQRSSALVLVSASVPSKITVSARVPGAPPKKRRAGASATIKLKPVTHLANPGQITKYKLKFTGALKAALANLPRSKSLALKVKASGANLAGVVKSEGRTLRLKGRG